ncbi:MAG: acyltransferase [Microbacterium sp.]|jgi:peptidoglycan/LPS O-acetylase OafA/YrhL|uniref:acyltransferase family protein n=1 Tax=Microbacterium sp. TaxID=51671 RepID=UPI0025F086FC|nr:acyltransferase [Microbacterium sp.]MBQ9916415.1 acyltransferase [Microbacterium sp.]
MPNLGEFMRRTVSSSVEMGTTPVETAYEAFRAARRFPGLDGLRALSILLVLTSHMHDPVWSFFAGGFGVTIFFGISGFLITTLLLREEDRHGRVSLKNFYIRRVFRILPMYFLALALTIVLVLGLGLGEGGSNFLERLPLLATFNGEFAGSGTFSHSWSLGIEEKFYIIWPLLAFGLLPIRNRLGAVLAVAVPAAAVMSYVPWTGYIGVYFPILGGCALAVAMHSRRSFAFAFALSGRWAGTLAFIAMIAMLGLNRYLPFQDQSNYAHVAFAVFALLAMPGILIGDGWQRKILSLPPVVYYGNLAYGIYLFHPFVGDVIDRAIPAGQSSLLLAGVRFAGMIVVSFAVAWVLRVSVEQPMIRFGRRLTSRTPRPGQVESDPVRSVSRRDKRVRSAQQGR